jgi:hypothetical protein
VFRFAPREADVEKARGCKARRCNIEGYDMGVQVLVARMALESRCRDIRDEDWRERREKEVESVERADDWVLCLGMRRRDLKYVECLWIAGTGVIEKRYLFLRNDGVLEGMESRTHLNMRPQIRHILRLGLAKL